MGNKILKSDLIKVEKGNIDIPLNTEQLNFLLQKTPKSQIRSRPAKGGGTWNYVSGTYVQKVLNMAFGWDWDFQVIKSEILIEAGEVVVLGRLTIRSNGRTIIKEQWGNKDIMFRRGTKEPLSVGNDLKSATTDALKKCASSLGIAQDVYAPNEFKEVKIFDKIPIEKGDANWDKIKEAIENGTVKLSEVLSKYEISDEDLKELEM